MRVQFNLRSATNHLGLYALIKTRQTDRSINTFFFLRYINKKKSRNLFLANRFAIAIRWQNKSRRHNTLLFLRKDCFYISLLTWQTHFFHSSSLFVYSDLCSALWQIHFYFSFADLFSNTRIVIRLLCVLPPDLFHKSAY